MKLDRDLAKSYHCKNAFYVYVEPDNNISKGILRNFR